MPADLSIPLSLALRLLGALETHAPPDARIRMDGSLPDLERRIREALRANGKPVPPPCPTPTA